MELNKVNGDILGVVATEDILDGKMVLLTTHSEDNDFGSLADIVGVKLPTSADEAKRARFVATWARDNRTPPYYVPMPAYAWALRMGWDQAANTPFSATVHVTYPGYKKAQTIPSGTACLAYGAGTYTVPSGTYIDHASLTKGALLSVSYAEATKGKLQYQATFDADVVVAVIEDRNTTNGDLTFKVGQF
jgi:hypothetical protein